MPDPGTKRLLVVNADDFGMSAGVNEGIVDAHVKGIVTSTSLMVNRSSAEHAASLLEAHPSLSVGLHLEDDGVHDLDDPVQAAELFAAQLERFRELTGSEPTHVDSHHHVHSANERLQSFRALAAPLAVPVRHDGRVDYVGGFWGQAEGGAANLDHVRRPFLIRLIADPARGAVSELGCHPAKLKGDLRSSYLEERAVELATLTAPGLGEEIEALGIALVSYRALKL